MIRSECGALPCCTPALVDLRAVRTNSVRGLDERRYELEQLREEKDQEIQVLPECVDSMLQQLAQMAQMVCLSLSRRMMPRHPQLDIRIHTLYDRNRREQRHFATTWGKPYI